MANKDQQKLKIEVFDPVSEINKKFDFYIKIVIAILIIAMLTMIVMTATLIVDSFHFNATTYQEYSKKIETLNTLQETNKVQLESIKQSQQLIQRFLEESKKNP